MCTTFASSTNTASTALGHYSYLPSPPLPPPPPPHAHVSVPRPLTLTPCPAPLAPTPSSMHASTSSDVTDALDCFTYHAKAGAIWGNNHSHCPRVESIETKPAFEAFIQHWHYRRRGMINTPVPYILLGHCCLNMPSARLSNSVAKSVFWSLDTKRAVLWKYTVWTSALSVCIMYHVSNKRAGARAVCITCCC